MLSPARKYKCDVLSERFCRKLNEEKSFSLSIKNITNIR